MRDWPPITEPELLARLAMDRDEFFAFAREFSLGWGHREYEPAYFERALGYPWERPAGSYLLREGQVSVLGDMEPSERETVVGAYTSDRHPIVAFGGNGSPSYLTTKFNHFASQEDLLDLVAPQVVGPGARAEDVTRAVFEDMAAVISRSSETLWQNSELLKAPWTSYPAGAG